MHYCFITGFLRSGTTLLEKLVHALPGACIGPQPFPFLYYDTKRAFLRARGCDAIQGYLLGRPVSADEIPAALERIRTTLGPPVARARPRRRRARGAARR